MTLRQIVLVALTFWEVGKDLKITTEFVKWFGPLLDALRDLGYSGKPREVSERIAKNLNLSDEILDQQLKSSYKDSAIKPEAENSQENNSQLCTQ